MAARKSKGTMDKPWSDMTRQKIQASMLINRLTDHVTGKVDLSATQIRAAEILLNKSLPNLTSVDLTGDITTREARELSDAELAAIATSSSAGTADQTDSEEKPSRVH